jgi:hypothetical protein
MRSGTAVNKAPVGGSCPRPVEQLGDPGPVHVGRGNVHPEPVSGQVTAVAEPDGSVE